MVDAISGKRPQDVSSISEPAPKRMRPCDSAPYKYRPLAQPMGNLLFSASARNARSSGLGSLSALPDELVSAIFSELGAADYLRCQATSRAFFAWSSIEGHWKLEFIKRSRGVLKDWKGSWRRTYIHHFVKPRDVYNEDGLPSDAIENKDIFSDVLYLPTLAANYAADRICNSSSFSNNIPRKDGRTVSNLAELDDTPCILTHLMDDWASLYTSSDSTDRKWTLDSLASRYPETAFRAEAVLTSMQDYKRYHDSCNGDESPLYIFDPDFVEKTSTEERARNGGSVARNGLGADFRVPKLFQDDLFKVLGNERPNFRWLIAGPARSGSTFHLDPNSTSAWNAVVTGRKLWICFPPDIVPPGIMVSEDWAEVEAPLSLAEWMLNFYDTAKKISGPKAKDPATRGKMLEGICETGEIFYVPSGWWHLVINLESSIAVTQNFVSPSNLPGVLSFLKHRADQVSGFKLANAACASSLSKPADSAEYRGEDEDETGGSAGEVYQRFIEALQGQYPEVLVEGLKGLAKLEMERAQRESEIRERKERRAAAAKVDSLWDMVKKPENDAQDGLQAEQGFSFGFDLGDAELDGDDIL